MIFKVGDKDIFEILVKKLQNNFNNHTHKFKIIGKYNYAFHVFSYGIPNYVICGEVFTLFCSRVIQR